MDGGSVNEAVREATATLPAFGEKYGNKEIMVILDNAPYHHGIAAESKVFPKAPEAINIELLRDWGMGSITVL